MGRAVLLLVFITILGSAYAGPVKIVANQDTCSRTCTESSKFNFVTGRTYQYHYDSELKTLVTGASEDHASLLISAEVRLEILSKCELSMMLKDVVLTEYDPVDLHMKDVTSEFGANLQRYPVRLSYQDGSIADICLTGEEPTWVLNVKRGIISLIQNNMKDFSSNNTVSETDVAGTCNTDYYVRESAWYTTTIGKSKNLLGCTDRHGYNSAVQGVPYTADSDIQSLPLLKSDHSCEHVIDIQSGYLDSAKCVEQHMFRPFSSSGSGAVTTGTQNLKFEKMTTGTKSPAPISSRVSLKFDHGDDAVSVGKTRKDITRKLMEICEKTKSGVLPETPKLFTDLVYLMKLADSSTLTGIHKTLTEGTICPDNQYRTSQFFLDALPMTGTATSLQLMTELITSKAVTSTEADMWLTTFAFIKNPTSDMLAAVKPLINMEDNGKTLLSVGSLVHSYCNHHDNCNRDSMVKAIISAFANKMVKGCKVTPDNMKTTLMALRGLGNAGYATSVIPQLEVCMKLSSNPVEIRLSAIEAFRRMPCDSSRSGLMKMLINDEEDSELRIAAYRVLMECPSDIILNTVRKVLATEEVNQVGSYIWSHLTNLMETSDRHKQAIRAVLEDETFKKEFDLDNRKFSRNYEGSVFVEKLNTGAKIEGDLIWSQKSFVPRSGAMNLTVDLFGHSVNLLEFGGRAEGLEYFLESFFGPSGYFSKQDPNAETVESETGIQNVRMDKINKMDRRMGTTMADLRGSLYMRVFGNELRYMNFHGLDDLLSGSDFNALDILIKLAEDNDYTYTHSTMFLDSSFIVPTSSGLPLNLTVNGTATVDLRLKGKMDLRKPPTIEINGLIQPSAAIDISSMMSVDAFFTKSGVKMVSTMHSSTAVQGKLSIDRTGGLTAQYDMPQPRMELIDVKSSFFTIHRDMEREQKMITDNRQKSIHCSPEQLVTITGLELCAEASYPNASLQSDAPFFPLTGPVSAGIYLYKRDLHTKYQMAARSLHNQYKNQIRVMFDTPGSKTDRHVDINLDLNKKDMSLDVTLTSPWKNAYMQGMVTNTRKLSGVSGKMNIDDMEPCSFDAKLSRQVNGNTYIYQPSFNLKSGKSQDISLRGMLSYKGVKQIDAQFSADGLTTEPIVAKMTIHNKPALQGIQGSLELAKDKQYSFDVNLVSQGYKKKTIYQPLVSIRTPVKEVLAFGGSITIIYDKKIDVKLTLDKIVDKAVTLKGFAQQLVKRRGRTIYRTKVNFKSSPADLALDAKIDNRNFLSIGTDIDFTYVIRRVARNNIKLVSKVINQSTRTLIKRKANMNLAVNKNPELNMKMTGEVTHNAKYTDIGLDVMYGPNFKDALKRIELAFEMNRKIPTNGASVQANVKSRFRFPAYEIASQFTGDHFHTERNLSSNFMFKYGKGEPVTGKLLLQDNTDRLLDTFGDVELSYPGRKIAIDHTFKQVDTTPVKYVSTLNAQTNKGVKNNIITEIGRQDDTISVSSDVILSGMKPANVQVQYGYTDQFLLTSLAFERDNKKYAGFVEASYDTTTSKMSVGIENPDQAGTITLTGRKLGSINSIEADLKWTNGSEDTKNVNIKGWMEPLSENKFNGSVTVAYPSRTLILNVHHILGSKYMTHADFQWDPDMKLSADTTVQLDGENFFGTASVKTPFMASPVNVDVSHGSNSEQYETKADINWGDSLTINSVVKKPVSLKTLVTSLEVLSSLKVIRRVRFEINHKMSASVASSAKFTWNKQFVQADVILQNTTKGRKVGFRSTINLKSSYKIMKKGELNIAHDNNGYTFNTEASFLRNKKAYRLDSTMTHLPSTDQYGNNGKVTISIPSRKLVTSWDHRHTHNSIASRLNSILDNKQLTAKLSGNFEGQNINTALEIQIPLSEGMAVFNHSFVTKPGFIDGIVSLKTNQNTLASFNVGYMHGPRFVNAGVTVSIPDLDVNSRFMMDARVPASGAPRSDGANATFSVVITPDITMTLNLSQVFLSDEHISRTAILWKSSVPAYEHFMYKYEVIEMDEQDGATFITTIQYAPDKVIKKVTTIQEIDRTMVISSVLTTPFESLPRMQGGFTFSGKHESFTSSADIEIVPYLDKTAASVTWDSTNGLSSSLQLDIPYPQSPRITLAVSLQEMNQGFNTSDVKIEATYGQGKTIQFEFSHDFTEKLLMSAKAVSPIGSANAVIDGEPQSLKSNIVLGDMKGKKYVVDAALFNNDYKSENTVTLKVPGKRDINLYITLDLSKMLDLHAEITHNRKNNFISDLSISHNPDSLRVSGSGSLRSELISETDEYDSSINIQGVPTKFSINGHVFTTSQGKTTADISFDITDKKEGSFIMKSPVFKNIKASFSHLNNDNSFIESNMEAIYGGQSMMEAVARYSADKTVVGEISLKTFATSDFHFETRFDGSIDNFVSHNEYTYGLKKGEAELSSKYRLTSLQQTITIKGTDIDDFSMEINHNGALEQLKSFAELNNGREKHRVDVIFNNMDVTEGSISLVSPSVRPVSANFQLQSKPLNFKAHAEMDSASSKSEIDVDFAINAPSVVTRFSIKSSLTKDVSASISHIGIFPNTDSRAQLSIQDQDDFDIKMKIADMKLFSLEIATPFTNFSNFETVITLEQNKLQGSYKVDAYYIFAENRSEMDITFQGADNKYQGQAKVNSHLVPAVSASFQHEGTTDDFKSHAEYSVDNDKSEVDITYSGLSRYKGTIEIKSHLTPDIAAGFEHSGPITNFKSHGELSIDGEKRQADLNVNLERDIDTNVRMMLPGQEDITAAFKHSGDLTKFQCHAEVVMGEKWEGDLSFSNLNAIRGKISLNPPSYLKSLSASFEHRGIPTNFNSHAEFILDNEKTSSDLSFTLADSSITSSFSLVSPYTEDVILNIRQTGFNVTNFMTDIDGVIGGQRRKILATVDLVTATKVFFQTNEPNILFLGTINQTSEGYVGSWEYNQNKEKYLLQFSTSMTDDKSFSLSVRTPIPEFYQFIFDIKHKGSLRKFENTVTMVINKSTSSSSLKFNALDTHNMDGNFEIKSPYLPELDGKFSNSFTSTKYIFSDELSVDGEIFYATDISYTIEDITKAEVEIVAPIKYQPIKIGITWAPRLNGFNISAELVLGSDQSSAEISLDVRPKMQTAFSVKSPYFPGITSTMELSGTMDKFNTMSDLFIDGAREGMLSVGFNSQDEITASIDADLPFSDYKNIHGEMRKMMDGTTDKITVSVLADKQMLTEIVFSYDLENALIDFTLASEVPHTLTAACYISSTSTDFNSHWHIKHEAVRLVDGVVSLKWTDPILASIKTELNLVDFNAQLRCTVDPAEGDYEAVAALKMMDKTWSISETLKIKDNVEGSFILDIPDRDQISGIITHTKRFSRSVSHVEFNWNDTTKYEYDMKLKWRNGYEGTFSLNTNIEGFKKSEMVISHKGSLPDIESSARVTFAGKSVSGSAQMDASKGQLTLKTPFEDMEDTEISFYNEGDLSDFKAGGKLIYTVGKEIALDIDHTNKGLTCRSKLRFMSPFTDEIILSANHSGISTDFSTNYELSMGPDNRITSKTTWKTGHQYLIFISDMTTVVNGEQFEQHVELKHDGSIENFKIEALIKAMDKEFRIDTSFQIEPMLQGSVAIVTPFENFEDLKASFSHSGSISNILSKGEIQYATKKKVSGEIELMQNGWRHFIANMELRTPFENMELNKISYKHVGTDNSMECGADVTIMGKELKGTLAASFDPISLTINVDTPFDGYEAIRFMGNMMANQMGHYSSIIITSWNPSSEISLKGSLIVSPLDGSITMSTPFECIESASAQISRKQIGKDNFREAVKIIHNQKPIVDIELDYNMQTTASVTVRAPRPMTFEIDGELSKEYVDVDVTLNWNQDDSESNLKILGGYDVRTSKTAHIKVSRPGLLWSFDGIVNGQHSTANIAWGFESTEKAGYDVTLADNGAVIKVILPTRSVEISGLHQGKTSEGYLMWDADVDSRKKIAFTSQIVPMDDAIKADITILMPSLGKNVQLGSEVIVKRGRVVFEGRTELKYSTDPRKTIMLSSKLEDISQSQNTNYSFSLEVSHPYTTVGVKLNSHAGKSSTGYSAGLGLEYLTTRRQTKTFQVNGRIDKIRKTMSFELQSPVKTISISGSAQKNSISLLNVYDRKQPLSTVFTFNPSQRSIDFYINYDLDSPNNEFHIRANYVNSTAVQAEIFHTMGRDRVTDVLVTARLNNSHLLHSRLHWRPEMIDDLEAFFEKEAQDYRARIAKSGAQVTETVFEEVVQKFHLIWDAVGEEIGKENVAKFEEAVIPLLDVVLKTYVSVSEPVYSHISGVMDEARERYYNMAGSYKTFMNKAMVNTMMIDGKMNSGMEPLRKNVSDKFNYVSDKLRVPGDHLPILATQYLGYATENMGQLLPHSVNTQMMQIGREWEVSNYVEYLLRSLIRMGEHDAEKLLRDLEKIVLAHMKSPFTVYDPAHGEIQLEQYLVIPVYSLDAVPMLDYARYIENVKNMVPDMPDISLPDISAEIIPPFKGVATISKGQRITTYDGYIYDLDSECTYVLARDFMDQNFTVTLSNDGDRTLSVITSGIPISINIQEQVMIGAEPAELPAVVGDMIVRGDANGVITISSGDHFTITYDTNLDHITVQVSGWYFGKTAGLLGIYDNEPSNDLMTSFNKVIDNAGRFAKTWHVGTTACQ